MRAAVMALIAKMRLDPLMPGGISIVDQTQARLGSTSWVVAHLVGARHRGDEGEEAFRIENWAAKGEAPSLAW